MVSTQHICTPEFEGFGTAFERIGGETDAQYLEWLESLAEIWRNSRHVAQRHRSELARKVAHYRGDPSSCRQCNSLRELEASGDKQVSDCAAIGENEVRWLRRLGDRVLGASEEAWIGDDPLLISTPRALRRRVRPGRDNGRRRRRYAKRR